jgi:WD40 repeat protein/serine/threonine protein kinase
MLRCPFCEADLHDVPLNSGRCPTCGGVMAWEDEEPEPPRRDVADAASVGPEAGGFRHAADEPPTEPAPPSPPSAVAIAETHEISEPLPGPTPPARSAGAEPPRERHSTIRLGDVGTVDEDEIQKTISPQPPSGDVTKTLKKLWSRTISPGAKVNQTVKTQDSLPVQPVSRRVPTRSVRNKEEPKSETADYRLLEIIGEGGVGIVYAAQQTSVDRTVAVKMLRSDITTDWEQRQKFLSEAVVTGDLDHPNIVPIYELGSGQDGALFYAMKRVTGTPWCDVLMDKPQEENLEILMKAADAVAFAHSRGIVHRDLKPENVMLGGFGEVQVMDWGIALPTARFHRAADILTTGSLGGTPAYMAPEMATGPIGRIGPTADVYLLGGILYEIVTGQTPHSGGDVMECLHAAAANEIQPTHKTGELMDIAMRAMKTNPDDRFQSVQEFQAAIREYQSHTESIALSTRAEDDLRHADGTRDYQDFSRALFAFQEAYALWHGNHRAAMGVTAAKLAYAQCALDKGDFDLGLSLLDEAEPTHQRTRARIVSAQRERDARQQRLKAMKRTAGLLVVVLFVVIGAGLVTVRIWQKDAERQKEIAVVARKDADDQREKAIGLKVAAENSARDARKAAAAEKASAAEAERRRIVANQQRARAEQQRQLALVAKSREEMAKLKTQYESYLARIALAAEKINGNAFDDARALLEAYQGDDMRHWEWARLWYLCQRYTADFPCGSPVDSVAFSPDGKEFATAGQDGTVRIWTTTLAQKPNEKPKPRLTFVNRDGGRPVPILSIAWSPPIGGDSETLIATGDERGSVKLWRPKDGTLFKPLVGHSDTVTSVAFSISSRRKWLVTGSKDNSAIVWDVTGKTDPLLHLREHSWWVWDVAVSPDQKRIATAGNDGKIFLWRIDGPPDHPRATVEKELAGYHNGPVYSIAFSPKDDWVVSGGFDNRVLVWKISEAKSVDLAARLRDMPEASPNWLVLRGHTGAVRSVQFSPDKDGRLVLSCSDDNTVTIWNATNGKAVRTLRGHGSFVRSSAFAPNAFQLNSTDPDDRLVLSGSHDGHAKLWRIAGYDDVRVYRGRLLQGHEDEVLAAVYSPDGRFIATAGKDRTIRVWDVQTGRIILPDKDRPQLDEGHEYLASAALFFRKGPYAGRRFVTSAMDGTVRIWRLDTGTEIVALRGAGSSGAMALSRDERELAACGRAERLPGGTTHSPILIWNVAALNGASATLPSGAADVERNRTPQWKLAGHIAEVTALAYSPDGNTLVSGDASGTALVWERTANGWSEPQPISRRANGRRHSKRITGIAFLDSGRVATASNDKSVSIWDVRTGNELAMISYPDSVIAMSVSPDGSRLVTSCRADSLVVDSDRKNSESLLRVIGSTGRIMKETTVGSATVSSVQFSPDGARILAMADEGHLWEWSPGKPAVRRSTGLEDMWAAVYSPAGNRVLTVGGRRAVLWDWRQAGTDPPRLMTFGPHAPISHLSFSPGGLRLASADIAGTVKVWDLKLHRAEQVLKHGPKTNRSQTDAAVVAALFSPRDDGLLFTIGAGIVHRWQFDAASRLWKSSKTFHIPGMPQRAAATAAAIAGDGSWLVIGLSNGAAIVCNTDGTSPPNVLDGRNGHTAEIRSVTVSADSQWIVTGSEDKSAIVWERTPDGKYWDAIAKLSGHPAPVNAVGISRDRFRVLTGSEDKTAKIWDTRSLLPGAVAAISAEKVRFREYVLDDLRAVRQALNDGALAGPMMADGVHKRRLLKRFEQLRLLTRPLVSKLQLGNEGDELKQLDRRALELVLRVIARLSSDPTADPAAGAAAPQDPTANWDWKALRSNTILLKRLLVKPQPITELFTLRAHQRGVTAVTFSPRGDAVLTGSRDGSAIVWPAVNMPPSVRGIGEPLEVAPPAGGVAETVSVAENAVVRDPDSSDFNGGKLVVSIEGGGNAGRLVFPRPAPAGAKNPPPITVNNGVVSFQRVPGRPPVVIGRLSAGLSDRRIAFELAAGADEQALSACLRWIGYQPARIDAAEPGAERRLRFEITDGDGELSTDLRRPIVFRAPPSAAEDTSNGKSRQQ